MKYDNFPSFSDKRASCSLLSVTGKILQKNRMLFALCKVILCALLVSIFILDVMSLMSYYIYETFFLFYALAVTAVKFDSKKVTLCSLFQNCPNLSFPVFSLFWTDYLCYRFWEFCLTYEIFLLVFSVLKELRKMVKCDVALCTIF